MYDPCTLDNSCLFVSLRRCYSLVEMGWWGGGGDEHSWRVRRDGRVQCVGVSIHRTSFRPPGRAPLVYSDGDHHQVQLGDGAPSASCSCSGPHSARRLLTQPPLLNVTLRPYTKGCLAWTAAPRTSHRLCTWTSSSSPCSPPYTLFPLLSTWVQGAPAAGGICSRPHRLCAERRLSPPSITPLRHLPWPAHQPSSATVSSPRPSARQPTRLGYHVPKTRM